MLAVIRAAVALATLALTVHARPRNAEEASNRWHSLTFERIGYQLSNTPFCLDARGAATPTRGSPVQVILYVAA